MSVVAGDQCTASVLTPIYAKDTKKIICPEELAKDFIII